MERVLTIRTVVYFLLGVVVDVLHHPYANLIGKPRLIHVYTLATDNRHKLMNRRWVVSPRHQHDVHCLLVVLLAFTILYPNLLRMTGEHVWTKLATYYIFFMD